MQHKITLSTEEIIRGLKHYRRIAKQDMLRAAETPNPEVFRDHAGARRHVYAELSDVAEARGPDELINFALELYKTLPFVTGTAEDQYPKIKGKENALENFFLMIGLDPKIRRETRKMRRPVE